MDSISAFHPASVAVFHVRKVFVHGAFVAVEEDVDVVGHDGEGEDLEVGAEGADGDVVHQDAAVFVVVDPVIVFRAVGTKVAFHGCYCVCLGRGKIRYIRGFFEGWQVKISAGVESFYDSLLFGRVRASRSLTWQDFRPFERVFGRFLARTYTILDLGTVFLGISCANVHHLGPSSGSRSGGYT